MADQKIVDYIKQSRTSGISDDQTRRALLAAGRNLSDLDGAFASLLAYPKPGDFKKATKISLLAIGIIILLFIGLVFIGLHSSLSQYPPELLKYDAASKGNYHVCLDIPLNGTDGEQRQKEKRQLCLYLASTNNSDPAICESMDPTIYSPEHIESRDSCFASVAEATGDKTFCAKVSDMAQCESSLAEAAKRQAEDRMRCGPLLASGQRPSTIECDEYVYSQHDLEKCETLKQTWNQEGCVKYVRQFLTRLPQYHNVKASSEARLAAFDSQKDIGECSWRGGAFGLSGVNELTGKCNYIKQSALITIKMKNPSPFYPMLFETEPYGILSKVEASCSDAEIVSINGGDNFDVQIDKGETFLMELRCASGQFSGGISLEYYTSGSGLNHPDSLWISLR